MPRPATATEALARLSNQRPDRRLTHTSRCGSHFVVTAETCRETETIGFRLPNTGSSTCSGSDFLNQGRGPPALASATYARSRRDPKISAEPVLSIVGGLHELLAHHSMAPGEDPV